MPDHPFFRLIYASRATEPVVSDALIAQALRNNPAIGITGGLACMDGVFLQYLEGAESDVEDLFERILTDARHTDVKVLERRAIPKRMFSDWSMASLRWTDATVMIFRSFSPEAGLRLYDVDPSTAAPLFRAWAATSEWQQGSATNREPPSE
jgi:hypothetical protein